MRKIVVVIGIVVLLALPLVLLVFRNSFISALLPKQPSQLAKPQQSARFNVKSEVAGYKLTLADASYLDYLADHMGIFGSQAIVDPRVHRGFPDLSLRYTVSHMQFVLVSVLDQPISALMGKTDPISMGGYSIDGDTLTMKVFLDIPQLTTGVMAKKYALEDTFIRTVGFTLIRARSTQDSKADAEARSKIINDIDEYLYKNMYPWPFIITPEKP